MTITSKYWINVSVRWLVVLQDWFRRQLLQEPLNVGRVGKSIIATCRFNYKRRKMHSEHVPVKRAMGTLVILSNL